MKKTVVLLVTFILMSFWGISQEIGQLDYISPFNDGVSAIKKGSQWAFINTEGSMIIDFRDDLVATKSKQGTYPVFSDGRCLITQKKDGIPYYGYIDMSGKTVITPRFLNAINFNNGSAIALELVKVDLGKNEILNKEVVKYKYFEVLIDAKGEIENYLTEAVYIGLTPSNFVKAPIVTSRFISEELIAIKTKNKNWSIRKID